MDQNKYELKMQRHVTFKKNGVVQFPYGEIYTGRSKLRIF